MHCFLSICLFSFFVRKLRQKLIFKLRDWKKEMFHRAGLTCKGQTACLFILFCLSTIVSSAVLFVTLLVIKFNRVKLVLRRIWILIDERNIFVCVNYFKKIKTFNLHIHVFILKSIIYFNISGTQQNPANSERSIYMYHL